MMTVLLQTAIAWSPSCPIEALLDVVCPGCGLTRALALCIQGDIVSAMALNPMAPVLALQGIGFVFVRSMEGPLRVDCSVVVRRCLQFDLVALPAIWMVRVVIGL